MRAACALMTTAAAAASARQNAPAEDSPARHACSQTVKKFVAEDKHEALDEMLKRYTTKQLGKQQVWGQWALGALRAACR